MCSASVTGPISARPGSVPTRYRTGRGACLGRRPGALLARALQRTVQGHAGGLLVRGVVEDAVQPAVAARPGRRVRHDGDPGVARLGVRDAHVGRERGVTRGGGFLADGGGAWIAPLGGPVAVVG